MALFFDLVTLEAETQCDPDYMVEALNLYYKGIRFPKNSRTKYKPLKKSLHGNSFLLNPESFFNDKITDIVYRAQYLRLAGRRDYALYSFHGYKDLDLSYYSDIDISAISSNPLLEITNNQIKFKYE